MLLILLPLLGAILAKYKVNSYIPWNIDVACFLFPFFFLGYYIGINKQKILAFNNIHLLFFISAILLSGLTLLKEVNGSVNIYRLEYGNSILFYYINGIVGIFGILLFSYGISRIGNRKLIYILCNIGRNTMIIMCYHQILNPIGLKITRIIHNNFTNNIIFPILIKYSFFIVEIALLVLVSIYIKKISIVKKCNNKQFLFE